MPKILIPASVQGMNPKQDRSWKLVFETRELSGEHVKVLADNLQGEGWLLFSPNDDIELKDIPEEPAEAGTKTPSERLRSVLYVLWEQRGKPGGTFEPWRITQMEKLIEHVKTQLDKES
jgi:hypothetical protein